ncbi:MAG TPA: AAA family ATPase [Candidatus Saccharimonadales bacterium]|nr:AAA family ATPase [Candidatus Saccharimonadales bacterium]
MTPNLKSLRSKQAQAYVFLSNKLLRGLLLVFAFGFIFVGLFFVYQGQSSGWLIMTLGVWPFLPVLWYEWWLKVLPVNKTSKSVDDLLEPGLLGKLPVNASPSLVAQIVMKEPGGLFFTIRFGIGPNFLKDLSSQNSTDSEELWETCIQLQRDLNLRDVSSSLVVAALIRVLPNRDRLLGQLQINFDDILSGVRWHHHLKDLIDKFDGRKMGGGIGRDLSFGYTNLLSQFTQNVSQEVQQANVSRELEGHQDILQQLLKQLANGGKQNAILIGPAGVGKTSIVRALAERIMLDGPMVPKELRFLQVMALDPAAIISKAPGRGEVEALVSQLMSEAYLAKNVILYLDNAELFFTNQTGAVDLQNILLPILEAGNLKIILSMDEQHFLQISRSNPNLSQQLNRISVPAMSESDTYLVCEDKVIEFEARQKVVYMYQALKAAYRLGGRYVSDRAMPGQALTVLESAAQFNDRGLVNEASIEKTIEQTFGVKIQTATNTEDKQTLLNLEQLIHQRMINQTRAVGVVANALRRARSGVRNQKRPIGTFLFLGPTGVGKTELAKALAAVYFGGEDRMVRLDLNEYSQPTDVSRLIADASDDPMSLTAQISKQPFSVVLLDEIEKAHPNVLNTLLQLLDEGILQDENNRQISFRDSIVIATSNAGADLIRKYISEGKQLDQFEESFINQLIDSGQFKPEFLNRFDEITVFRPLTVDELLQVVDLILQDVSKTISQEGIEVKVDEAAKKKLVEIGYDPRLGARPLRRVVQRTVENIIAKRVLSNELTPGSTVVLSLVDIEEALKA